MAQYSSPFMLSIPLTGIASSVIAIAVVYALFFRARQRFPPGPPRAPLIGNLLQLPKEYKWLKFSEWSKKYGDLIYLEVLKQPMIIVSSVEIANELLGKRSQMYSDRPKLEMGYLSGFANSMGLAPYEDLFKMQRKFVAQEFSPSAVPQYQNIQEAQARKLMQNILENPDKLVSEVELCIGSIVLRATHGYSPQDSEDPFLKNGLAGMDNFSKAAAPGEWLVDVIPLLKYVPGWLPGTGFLEKAREWTQVTLDAAEKPYEWAKGQIKNGTSMKPNLCDSILSNNAMDPTSEKALMWGAVSMLGGGMDTSMSTIMTFVMTMILFPNVQRKAQAEIDAVVGQGRLPSIMDRVHLPYVRSLITEVYRWYPSAPLSIAHRLTQDDVYNDLFLPKGSLVLPNVWHMLHDPKHFPNPSNFNPDRYEHSDTKMKKVTDLAFGVGRRRCPGYDFAQQMIFAVIATALATCDILPALDENGNSIMPDGGYTDNGVIVFPTPFKWDLKARSEQAEVLLADIDLEQ